MARIQKAKAVYEVADLFRERCLTKGVSLLWPEHSVWTVENLSLLWEAFIGHPDTTEQRNFFEKWKGQLANVPEDVHRVAADVISLYFLFPSNIALKTKLLGVKEVVSWKLASDEPEYSVLEKAYSQKIGSPGLWYLAGRPWHVAFYIDFGRRILSGEASPNDVDGCKKVAEDAVDTLDSYGDTEATKHIILHLLFPDLFERIASTDHKVLIVKAFQDMAGETTDVDDALAKIREGLTNRYERPTLDFYDDDIHPLWMPPEGPRYWIEKTIVKGRPDREAGDYALGKALWSPQKGKGGADIYRFMREVQPDDVVFHLTDNSAFTGVSHVASSVEDFGGVAGTEWDKGPSYLVRLRDFQKLDPPLERDVFFGESYAERLVALLDADTKNPFYSRELNLNQGHYLTPAPKELVAILDEAYQGIAGRPLVTIEKTPPDKKSSWIFQANPEIYDLRRAIQEISDIVWLVVQQRDEIHVGDRVYLWESGPDGGIVAVGEIRSEPAIQEFPEMELPYLRDDSKLGGEKLRAGVHILKVVAPVVKRDAVRSDPRLANLSILNNARGSNFPVLPKEAEALEDLISKRVRSFQDSGRQPIYTLDDFVGDTGFPKDTIAGWDRQLRRKMHVVFQGPPGTGKTYIAERLARLMVSGTSGFWELVQFHPSYAYEDFIQGIRPRITESGISYELVDGRFLEFCRRAKTTAPEAPCVLIIDEINRANLSRVFGELMYLLEYRDKDIPLAAGGDKFRIPNNVYIIGTMNTADRSIALVDYALRRRFCFIRLRPQYEVLTKHLVQRGYPADALVDTLKEVNKAIADPNYEIGISFFMKDDELHNCLGEIWSGEIEPYLEEYFYDNPPKVGPFRWNNLADGKLKPLITRE